MKDERFSVLKIQSSFYHRPMGVNLKHVVPPLGTLAFILGVLSFLVYPDHFSMMTYMSENALSPSWSVHAYSSNRLYTNLAFQFSADYHAFQTSLPATLSNEAWSKTTAEWISKKLAELHLNPHISSFPTQDRSPVFAPHHNITENMYLVQLSLESPRSLGAEAVILTARYERLGPNAPKPSETASYSWSFLASFLHMVQHQHWRSKDIIVVFSPEPAGTRGVEFWIERLNNVRQTEDYQFRHSFIIAALTIDIPPVPKFQRLAVKPESVLGTLPNLDLPNSIFRIAYRCDMRYLSWTPSHLISFEKLPFLAELLKTNTWLSPYLTAERLESYNTMFSFMLNMALGEPTGDHSAISKYKIEAVTISGVEPHKSGMGTVKRVGEMLEGTLRSLNNLIEPLHQSFYYYIPLGPFIFVPIGHYMISFALMFVPTALWVLLTVIPASTEHLAFGAKLFSRFCFLGLVAYLLPSFLPSFLPFFEAFAPLQIRELLLTSHEAEHVAALYFSLFITLSIAVLVGFKSRSNAPNDEQDNVSGALAMVPYLLFMAAAALTNASFAMIALPITLPPLAFVLLKRRVPKFIKTIFALFINPISLIAIYCYLYPSTTPGLLLTRFATNWYHYRGLIFPFTCLYFSMTLHGLAMSF